MKGVISCLWVSIREIQKNLVKPFLATLNLEISKKDAKSLIDLREHIGIIKEAASFRC